MYLRRTTRRVGDKTYQNYLLVESVATPNGPRQRVICSLGALAPGPKDEWLGTARRLHAALAGQTVLVPDPPVDALVARAHSPRRRSTVTGRGLTIDPEGVTFEDEREAGPVHVGHQMWRVLQLDTILADAGMSRRARLLTEVMTLNRLVRPAAEHAMPDWIRRTALGDILGTDFTVLSDEALYRNLDRLHPQRARIEQALAARERTLFNLDDTLYLYDLTSTYFEGQCPRNPQAKRGYSRDSRPDCKQVVIGLVLDRDGFPKAHEIFDGNRQDRSTLGTMLATLEERTGRPGGATVVVDRGMAYADNLAQINARGHHYLVASRQEERLDHLEAFEDDTGWAMDQIMSGAATPAQVGAFAVALRAKGETADELAGLAQAMLDRAAQIAERVPLDIALLRADALPAPDATEFLHLAAVASLTARAAAGARRVRASPGRERCRGGASRRGAPPSAAIRRGRDRSRRTRARRTRPPARTPGRSAPGRPPRSRFPYRPRRFRRNLRAVHGSWWMVHGKAKFLISELRTMNHEPVKSSACRCVPRPPESGQPER